MSAAVLQKSIKAAETTVTSQQYLTWERKQRLRHEFIDGKIYTMAGASRNHNKITFNINGLLWVIQQDFENFEAFSTDIRTYAPLKESYVYPDIVLIKGDDQYLDDEFDTLTNPTAVFEVASKSTKQFDKSKKFDFYRSIPTLEEYVLIEQSEMYITHFYKNTSGEWVIGEILKTADAQLKLKCLPIVLSVGSMYKGAHFKAKK